MNEEDTKEAQDITALALEQPLKQDSDIAGVMKILNEDKIESDSTSSKLSSIDLKTRLHPHELSSIVIHDSIIALNCLPIECLTITRTKKRLAVSLKGLGREEMVSLVQGDREAKSGSGFKIGRLFGKKE